MNAGEFKNKIDVMKIIKDENGDYALSRLSSIWVKLEPSMNSTVYSKNAVGTYGAKMTTRFRSFKIGDIFRYNGDYFIIAADTYSQDGLYFTANFAKVYIYNTICRRNVEQLDDKNRPRRTTEKLFVAPMIIGEKYVRYENGENSDSESITLIATVNKQIQLKTGDIVEFDGNSYHVGACHELNEYMNDYELHKRREA